MKRSAWNLGFLVFVAGIALAAVASIGDQLIAALLRDRPTIRWDMATLVEGDFNGDGKSDAAVIGYEDDRIVLALSLGGKMRKIQYLEFTISASEQAAVCETPVHLKAVPLSCETDDGKLPGCVANRRASALTIDDTDCDPINLYWDHKRRRLGWWRN